MAPETGSDVVEFRYLARRVRAGDLKPGDEVFTRRDELARPDRARGWVPVVHVQEETEDDCMVVRVAGCISVICREDSEAWIRVTTEGD